MQVGYRNLDVFNASKKPPLRLLQGFANVYV